jgi:diguanylate cyclase (GGDEF)-like protein
MERTERGPSPPVGARVKSWLIWRTPPPLRSFIVAVEVLTLSLIGVFLASDSLTAGSLTRFMVLLSLGIAAEEGLARIERMRFRLSTGRNNDLTSVFIFAGALALPPTLTVLLTIAIRAHVWYRHAKTSGQLLYRQVFTGSTMILAGLSAQAVMGAFGQSDKLTAGVSAFAGTVCAIVLFAAVNSVPIYVAISLAMRPAKPEGFFVQWQENLLEIATLCLGALTGLAVLYEPWFVVLVLPTMVVLQRATLTKELEVAATTDAKTGLLNAVTWQQLAQRELARAQREKQNAALLIIDMDNFKLINDTYGHLIGDAVLKAVAACLTDELRGYDAVGRFGGEEFVAMLADSDSLTAVAVSDRILARIRKLEVSTRDVNALPVAGLSASIGIACYPQQGDEVEDLLHAADAALYRAKNAGRNRVEFHTKAL